MSSAETVIHNGTLTAAQALLRLAASITPVIRWQLDGPRCVGQFNTCSRAATVYDYCVQCAYKVHPELMTIKQVFNACGNDRILIRNGVRYAICGSKPRRLCCGSGNSCKRHVARGCLCGTHHKRYSEIVGDLVTMVDGVKLRKRGANIVRICDVTGCGRQCVKHAYCLVHKPI